MTDERNDDEQENTRDEKVTANPQPSSADKPPIPQPPTDGFPTGEKDLTSRVPGESEDVKEERDS